MRNAPGPVKPIAFLLVILAILSNLPVVGAQQAPLKFKLSPSTIPAGRTRTIRINAETGADLTSFELEKPPDDSGVVIEEPGGQLVDGKTAIVARIKVDADADEQLIPLTLVKKDKGKVIETYTVDLSISAFAPKTRQKSPVPSGLKFEVDAMFQPMSYQGAKDIFGRRVANHYYAVVVSLGNNTGFDLQINKIGFVTTTPIHVADLNDEGEPIFENGKVKMRNDLLAITAIDRSLVRSSIEKDQNFGMRALALNLIGGVGTLTTGFLPFFHALGPKANFSSFTSVLNGNLKEGFTTAVPDLTIRHLNRLDNSLVMDQDFVLPNNSERNTIVFVPRKTLQLDKDHTDDKKDRRDDLPLVKEKLGRLVLVGRKIDMFENRQIVVRSDRPSLEPEPFASPSPANTSPITIERVVPDYGTLSESTNVMITGTGFTPGTAVTVKFGDRETLGAALTSTTVRAMVPPNATAGPIDVEVWDANRKASPLKNGYSYVDELKVESVDPATGSAAGGVVVKIKGKGFLAGAEVKFGDVLATNVAVANDHNAITATIPAHAAGKVEVKVKNTNGKSDTLPNGFTYSQ
jgi:hypothetical protein